MVLVSIEPGLDPVSGYHASVEVVKEAEESAAGAPLTVAKAVTVVTLKPAP